MNQTGTTATVHWFEWNATTADLQEVFPCRCGATHRGEYAQEDRAHHECFHTNGLAWLEKGESLMCISCGAVLGFEETDEQN